MKPHTSHREGNPIGWMVQHRVNLVAGKKGLRRNFISSNGFPASRKRKGYIIPLINVAEQKVDIKKPGLLKKSAAILVKSQTP